MKNFKYIFIFLSFLFFIGCSTIITSQDPNADIYVNGVNSGKGTVKISRMGTFGSSEIEAKRGNQTVGKTIISRSFTWRTFAISVYTYGLGLFFSWEYDDKYFIPCEMYINNTNNEKYDPWEPKKNSKWNKK